MAKGPYDDIVRAVLERLGASAPKAAKPTAKKAASATGRRTTRKAASVPAKPMTKAERSAANKAAWAKQKAQRDAKLAAERPAKKAKKTAEAKAKGIARGNRRASEAYGGEGVTDIKIGKAKAFFEREVDKAQRIIDATDSALLKGRDTAKIDAEIRDIKKYMEKEGYTMSPSDVRAIIAEKMRGAGLSNKRGRNRLKFVVDELKGKSFKETVEMGSRRARQQEVSTGRKITGSTPARITKKEAELQKRLVRLREQGRFDAVIKKADSKIGTPRGPRKKSGKKVVEQESSKRLRAAQEKNAKRSVVDPRVAAMSPTKRKKFLAQQKKEWKRLKGVKVSGQGMTDKQAKDTLAELGKRELPSSRVRSKPAEKREPRVWVRDKQGKLVPKKSNKK
ncbi:hypothetical protein UFOVP355_53 [uncultured Caudovirales phage]|uniref:Uncharacterized protein n=1 Tax=uncultured Caudovirales phage TaxID=2100421 RepID=A0A6J5LZQ7_9CAUD|nr:hypothetical protein UFOVP355_53 [uncultured Caudovirales phage]CAB4156952.1 hypothetical protein UFOVP677_53 [uncultured Caudovirales phage]